MKSSGTNGTFIVGPELEVPTKEETSTEETTTGERTTEKGTTEPIKEVIDTKKDKDPKGSIYRVLQLRQAITTKGGRNGFAKKVKIIVK